MDRRLRPRPARAAARCAALAIAVAWTGEAAAADRPPQQAVEAAIAYNILKFVEWPEGSPLRVSASLDLCVLGDPRFAEAAAAGLAARSVGGRSLRVREIAPDGHDGCHAVFLGAVPDPERAAFLLAESGVVTFARGPGLGARGVLFNFYTDRDRVRFEVNLAAARRARVKVSARLLSLARLVGEDAP